MNTTEAINIALQSVGEQPISDLLDIPNVYEAQQAELILNEVRRDVLSAGLYGNTESGWPLTADGDGYIDVPTNVLRVDAVGNDLVAKEGRLYNKADHTYIFEADSTEEVDIIWDLFYDNLQYEVAYYIALRTARMLYQRLIGVSEILNVLIRDEENAKIRMVEADADIGDYNIFDSAVNSRAIIRSRNPQGIRG
jgi:hypothetical protein